MNQTPKIPHVTLLEIEARARAHAEKMPNNTARDQRACELDYIIGAKSEYLRSLQRPGPIWVKAAHMKPPDNNAVCLRIDGVHRDAGFFHQDQWFTDRSSFRADSDRVEWLDESGTMSPTSDIGKEKSLAFAEWTAKMFYTYYGPYKKWIIGRENGKDIYVTTSELYDIFSKNTPKSA